jgi:hypothetical protein
MADTEQKTGPRRNPTERVRDRQQIAEWYLTGKTQQWIADELSRKFYPGQIPITRAQISIDLKAVIEYWRESALHDINDAKQVELEKLNKLEATYWEAWERSCANKQTKAARKRGTDAGNTVQSVTDETRDGNPMFLAGVERVMDSRAKILGIYAPVKNESTAPIIVKVEYGERKKLGADAEP